MVDKKSVISEAVSILRVAKQALCINFIRRELQVACPVHAGLSEVEKVFTRVFVTRPRERLRASKKTGCLARQRLLIDNGNLVVVTMRGKNLERVCCPREQRVP